jgi:hypothetical protein
MTNAGSDRKFVIVHEIGHRLLREKLGSNYGTNDVSHNASSPCESPVPANNPTNGSHRMLSKEFNSGAFHEGFAHFYSLITWNSASDSDAVFYYHGTPYEAEPGPGTWWMRQNCESPYNGYGNETDWMRFFWIFHRPVDGAGRVPFNDILGIFNTIASPVSQMGAYNFWRMQCKSSIRANMHRRFPTGSLLKGSPTPTDAGALAANSGTVEFRPVQCSAGNASE